MQIAGRRNTRKVCQGYRRQSPVGSPGPVGARSRLHGLALAGSGRCQVVRTSCPAIPLGQCPAQDSLEVPREMQPSPRRRPSLPLGTCEPGDFILCAEPNASRRQMDGNGSLAVGTGESGLGGTVSILRCGSDDIVAESQLASPSCIPTSGVCSHRPIWTCGPSPQRLEQAVAGVVPNAAKCRRSAERLSSGRSTGTTGVHCAGA